MKKFIIAGLAALLLAGSSGYSYAEEREEAFAKTFNYDYSTCYWKMDDILKAMPNVTVYSEKYSKILLYYINPNTTEVGVYFTAVDATHTRVEVESESSSARRWIANNIFSETVKKPEELIGGSYKNKPSKTRDW